MVPLGKMLQKVGRGQELHGSNGIQNIQLILHPLRYQERQHKEILYLVPLVLGILI